MTTLTIDQPVGLPCYCLLFRFFPPTFLSPPFHSNRQSHHLQLLAHSHLTEVDGEDGVRAGALSVHLGAGRGPGQSTEFQTLQQLQGTHATWRTCCSDQKKMQTRTKMNKNYFNSILFTCCFLSLYQQGDLKVEA